MITEEQRALLEQYQKGELSGEALEQFEKEIEQNPGLKAALGQDIMDVPLAPQLAEPQEAPNNVPIAPQYDPVLQNPSNAPQNKTPFWIWLLLGAFLILSGLYIRKKFGPKKNDGSFALNFSKPESLLSDNAARIGETPAEDSLYAKSEFCKEMLAEADRLYKKGDLESAQEPLLMMVLDTTGACTSDAYFYLGIIRLDLNDPQTAIQCFTKIEDFTRFGDDIQWYQSLAFVKMAEQDPSFSDRAKGAMNRILNSSQSDERKRKAQEILEKWQ